MVFPCGKDNETQKYPRRACCSSPGTLYVRCALAHTTGVLLDCNQIRVLGLHQHPPTASRKHAVLTGTIFENCDTFQKAFSAAPSGQFRYHESRALTRKAGNCPLAPTAHLHSTKRRAAFIPFSALCSYFLFSLDDAALME